MNKSNHVKKATDMAIAKYMLSVRPRHDVWGKATYRVLTERFAGEDNEVIDVVTEKSFSGWYIELTIADMSESLRSVKGRDHER